MSWVSMKGNVFPVICGMFGIVIDANWLHTAALKLTAIADALPPQNITLLPK